MTAMERKSHYLIQIFERFNIHAPIRFIVEIARRLKEKFGLDKIRDMSNKEYIKCILTEINEFRKELKPMNDQLSDYLFGRPLREEGKMFIENLLLQILAGIDPIVIMKDRPLISRLSYKPKTNQLSFNYDTHNSIFA